MHGGAARLAVDQQYGARIGEPAQRLVERDRPVALALRDRQQAGFRGGAGVGVDGLPVGDDEALRRQRLQPDVVGSRCYRALDTSGQELLERREQDILQVDGQRQQPIEEGGDRRQLVLDAVAVGQLQPGRILECAQRATIDLAHDQQDIELAQRVAGVVTLQIVFGPEQALAAGLALALGDGAQRVEPAGDGREEALLGLHVRRDRPK